MDDRDIVGAALDFIIAEAEAEGAQARQPDRDVSGIEDGVIVIRYLREARDDEDPLKDHHDERRFDWREDDDGIEILPLDDDAPDRFDERWRQLEREGACDGFGGMEYRRVRAEWLASEGEDLDGFIRRRANVGPYDDCNSGPSAA